MVFWTKPILSHEIGLDNHHAYLKFIKTNHFFTREKERQALVSAA